MQRVVGRGFLPGSTVARIESAHLAQHVKRRPGKGHLPGEDEVVGHRLVPKGAHRRRVHGEEEDDQRDADGDRLDGELAWGGHS